MIWYGLTCIRYKTQEILKITMEVCIIVTLQFLLKYSALDKEIAVSWCVINEDLQKVLLWKFIEFYPNFFCALLLKWNEEQAWKTRSLNLRITLTMVPLYVNWSIADCSSDYMLLYSKIRPLRHGPDLILLERNNQITARKI